MTMNMKNTAGTAPAYSTKRRRALIAAAATLAVLGVGGGGYALHEMGVQQGREAAAAATVSTAPSPDPKIATTDAMCGGRFVVTVEGKRYLLVDGGATAGQLTLIDVDANQRDQPCATGAADAAHTAQRFTAWDRDTQGCVKTTVIDGREWIISNGWGLIPANGRVPGSDAYGKEASEQDAGKCQPVIRWGEKNADGTVPATPPEIVPPIEDTAGYRIDSRVKCSWDDSKWEKFHFVPTLNTCVPFTTDGNGFKIRGDAAGDPTPR